MLNNNFYFGLEAEFLIVDSETFNPLWHPQLSFEKLNHILEAATDRFNGNLEGLEIEKPHTKLMPYAVEGYAIVDQDFFPTDLLPKGIEIRTPVRHSIEDCLVSLHELHTNLQIELKNYGLLASSLSHHPTESKFYGPQNKRRHDYWQWSMEVMTTYGPDFNISLPQSLRQSIDPDILDQKVNYYGPSMVAFSLASPFLSGEPWKIRDSIGKSVRTYRRSILAPLIELHPEENGRMEFKGFDMPWHREDFHAYFLLWLTLLLDTELTGRASKSSRIFDLGQVARLGWHAETIQERADEILNSAFHVLPQWGFETKPLFQLRERLLQQMTPADLLIQDYYVFGNLRESLKRLTCLN